MIDPRSRSSETPVMLASLVARIGLAGVSLIWASSLPPAANGQELVSSRRSAGQMPPQSSVPMANLIEDESNGDDRAPARLPPLQNESLYENLPPQPDGFNGDPAMLDGQGAYGQPTHGWVHGLKRRLQDCYWGYPEEFCERPYGMYNHAALDAMIGNGLGDFLILYQFDFHDGSQAAASQLNHAGITRLHRIVRLLRGNPRSSIVVVENIPGELRLSRARQQEVAAQLARLGVDERSASVMLGRPRRGLIGDEAVANYRNLIYMSNARGAGMTGAGNGGSSGNLGISGGGGNQGGNGSQSR